MIKSDKLLLRRQDLPKVYALNGAVYVVNCKSLIKNKSFIMKNTSAYEMPVERSLDIDTKMDLYKMKAFLSLGGQRGDK